ncbi:hypothetical protein CPAST_c10460 [Clostridium pasteurianum DSM 525 = ATCC 6013]|uniref:Uncharacterized protein n=1 Tax=Clostridium pasteurianum DSM 525 = ATCC 6013 TaxID=1262449 RepID=A0A0H3J009_CLOPA|nr:hypothetical protein [Clostridium pasteurianum]AJA47146.1 hypothetical protein CPAST_c10460 [Clostridium pasteurianum DSM 525 = ATCC 6013]AJA51134.1 hypothetical protein CLPA_c10460 [Clostridium pasteurianum DSM 525 = ATCC 6013]KRU12858.1 hypothetical protein CP6013_02106 [Clostridium pasteurianum DSM 525 = ATCC 6013]UZW15312.1 hypothetical protein OSC52_05595 [Clostridium pasteurianum]
MTDSEDDCMKVYSILEGGIRKNVHTIFDYIINKKKILFSG